MTQSDKMFAGSIPALYDRFLGPLLFAPYAADMARRAAEIGPSRLLETAAGTGIVTRQLAETLPDGAAITATDLNPGMLELAAGKLEGDRVALKVNDAMQLAFDDGAFDAVICQFGVMFFPDKTGAYAEARRVLRPGGTFLFNVWDSLEENELPRVVSEAVAERFAHDPPDFLARTPYGHHDVGRIQADLEAAGFSDVKATKVPMRARAPSPRHVAMGFCQGTPLRAEIEARDPAGLDRVTDAAADALTTRFGPGALDVPMQAIVITATA